MFLFGGLRVLNRDYTVILGVNGVLVDVVSSLYGVCVGGGLS